MKLADVVFFCLVLKCCDWVGVAAELVIEEDDGFAAL